MAGKRGSSRKKRGSGSSPWVLLLYPLTAAGGVYLGVQAYNVYQNPPSEHHASQPAAGRSASRAPAVDDRSERPRSRRRDSDDALVDARARRKRKDHAGETPKDNAPADPLVAGTLPTPAAGDSTAQPVPSPARSVPPGGEPSSHPVEVHPAVPSASASSKTAAFPRAATGPATPVPPIEIERGASQRREVALTFDAGSDWKPVKKILSALADQGVKSTFFLTGEWVQKNPKSTMLIAQGGHELGNHSWNHPPFTHLSADEIRSQLRRTEAIIQDTAGRSSRPYFRPPLGDRNLRVRQVVGGEGFFTVYWTLDSRDSVDKGITAEQIRDRVLSKAGAGSIVLMHCGSQPTADALPAILKGLRDKGLTPVTISRLMEE